MTSSNERASCLRRIDATLLVNRSAPIVLVVVLLTPSIWMLTLIPPLWRDVDAYIQVTQPPGSETILQYSPLYCFAARIPLYLGHAIECIKTDQPWPSFSFFVHPTLTDSGVFLLLLLQHAALCSAAFYLITVTSGIFWVRLILAIVWAANPLFYSFAHCVGGETLSLILTLLIGAIGLRIIGYPGKIPANKWLLFGVLLWLCILARHINAVLAVVLPVTFVVVSICRFIGLRFARPQPVHDWNRSRWQQALRNATIALVIGLSCIMLANAFLRVLCYAANVPYHSVVGLAFVGRLKFLAALPSEQRNQLLDQATKNTDSADVKNLIAVLRNESAGGIANWHQVAFIRSAQAAFVLSPGTLGEQQRLDIALNGMVRAFLWPPEKIFMTAIATDFKRSQQITIPDVVAFLFVTTRFYFAHRDAMPQCAALVTFRSKDADRIFEIFKKHSYFRHPKKLAYHVLLLLWVTSFLLLVAIAMARKKDVCELASYATALMAVGVLIMLANCFLAVFQPRYTLPMWELTIISVASLLGAITEVLFHRSGSLYSPERNDPAKHSDYFQGS